MGGAMYLQTQHLRRLEMMALYRSKKINPLGGCLPVLVQIPVFIALYCRFCSAVLSCDRRHRFMD